LSSKTNFLVFTMFIALVLTLLLYLMDIQFRIGGYFGASLVIMIALVLYALLSRIAEKLRHFI
jgi:hypothetical protein